MFEVRKCPICSENGEIIGFYSDPPERGEPSNDKEYPLRKCRACDFTYFDSLTGVNDSDKSSSKYYQDDLKKRMIVGQVIKKRHLLLDRLIKKSFKDNINILNIGAGTSSVTDRISNTKFHINEYMFDVYPDCVLNEKYKFLDLNSCKRGVVDNQKIDLAIIDNVLEHVNDFNCIKILLDKYQPSLLYVSVPNRDSIKYIGKKEMFYWPTQHVNNFNDASIDLLLNKLGYKIKRKLIIPKNVFDIFEWVYSISLLGKSFAGVYRLYEKK